MARRQTTVTADVPKIIIPYEDEPLIHDLGYDDHIKVYKASMLKQLEYKTRVEETKTMLYGIVEAVHADTISYGEGWLTTIVRSQPGKKLNIHKVIHGMGVIGKLTADTIKKILTAAEEPTEAKKPYLLVTPPKGTFPKKEKDEDDE